jgi:gliding motility-associated-like protein
LDEFYKVTFNLPANGCGGAINTPGAFCMSLDFYTDNSVSEIFVNNVPAFLNPIPNPYYAYGFQQGNQLTVSLCNYWQPGTNTVIVHVKSGPPFTGILAQINQTIMPGGTPTDLNATTVVNNAGCGSNNGSATVSTTGGNGTITYTWLPTGGNANIANNLAPGNYTVAISSGNCNFTRTLSITQPASPTIAVSNNTILCTGATTTLTASGADTYTWSNGQFGPSTSINSAGNYTVYGTNALSGCVAQHTVNVLAAALPNTSVTPALQAITCNSAALTFTGTSISPTINVQHDWYSPLNPLPGGVPISSSNGSITLLGGALSPGVYTLQTTDLFTGCISFKTVTLTAIEAWPTYSLSSPTNFSIGCAPLHQTTISIINPVSTQTPPATCSYTFLPPSFVGVVTPSIILGNNTSTVTQTPGTWTIIVQDNSNFCRTIISVPIIQNTVAPNVSANMLTQTLTCYNPTVLATGTSTTPNAIVTWGVPSTPPLLSTHTVVIGIPANGPNTSTTSLTYANYTVIATNTINACQSTSVITINQNFKPPVSSPTISIGTPTAIYCTVAYAPVVLTTGNSTTTSGGGPLAFVVNPCWQGPSPQAPICGPSSYSCYIAGVYSLTVQDNYNGCTKTNTINILDRTQPPVLASPSSTSILDCGADQATLIAAQTGTSVGGLKYWFYDYPKGAAFSPSTCIEMSGTNVILNGTTQKTVNVSIPGVYKYTLTNTLTGCSAYGTYTVSNGQLEASFTIDKETGYPPFIPTFSNTSSTSLGNNGINSIWSYGNGTSQTTSDKVTNTVYQSPGTYTVTLYASKGSCIDTVYKVVKVELPSKLEVPNIFTPNGDGNNDIFFFKVASIREVITTIFDRWGNKVYETTSSTGNVAWDGKSFSGKECAVGVYFYIVKAVGQDDVNYEMKGNVSLIR